MSPGWGRSQPGDNKEWDAAMNYSTAYGRESTQSPLDIARGHLRDGWSVTPLQHGQKKPALDNWRELRVTEANLPQHFNGQPMNFGGLTGEPSGWRVVVDLDAPETVTLAEEFLPPTGLVHGRPGKPGSHQVYIVEGARTERFKDVDGVSLVEILSTGAQVVLPGSLHPAEEEYRWECDGEPTVVPAEELRFAVMKLASAAMIARHYPVEGSRNDAGMALTGFLMRSGWDKDETRRFVTAVAKVAGDDEWRERGRCAEYTAQKLEHGEDVTGGPRLAELLRDGRKVVRRLRAWLNLGRESAPRLADAQALTDAGNARRLVERHGEDLRYVTNLGFLLWDGRRWVRDEEGLRVLQLAKETINSIFDEAKAELDSRRREELAKHASRSLSRQRLEAMVALARSEPEVRTDLRDLDADPLLLNVLNGTIDLRTNELRPHDRDDLLTKLAPVEYDLAADCPEWLRFLDRIMGGNPRLIQYLRRFVGYALTGETREKAVLIGHGGGDNGKTTFVETLQGLLGEDYAMTTPEATIAATRNDAIPNDVARLRAARLVVVSETSENLRLNEGRVKAMTGRNRLAARFLHAEWFEFAPEFKLFIETNHRPQIQGTDDAVWNRLKLVPFTVTIPKAEQDKGLPDKLRAELPGILRWALEGCAEWQREGLGEPPEVMDATREYRDESDLLAEFLDARCVRDKGNERVWVHASSLYTEYVTWCDANRERALSQKALSQKLQERGVGRKRVAGAWRWVGLGLKERPMDRQFDDFRMTGI